MSTGRVLWIIWCLFWAACWFVLGFIGLVVVVGPFICWPLAIVSVVAILLPVGQPTAPTQSRCPGCGALGDPALLPIHWQAAHATPAAQLGWNAAPRPVVLEQQPYGAGPPVAPQYGRPPAGSRPFPLAPGPPTG